VVFWRTRWQFGKEHQYMSVAEAEEFKRLPSKLRTEEPDLADIVQRVLDRDIDQIFQQMIDAWDAQSSKSRIN